MKIKFVILGFVVLGASSGCSASSSPGAAPGGDAGCSGSCGGSAAAAACPSSQPQSGASCSLGADAVCEYGDDVRVNCRVLATCKSNKWSIDDPGCGHMAQQGENGCPVAHPTQGDTCPTEGLVCQILGGDLCACSICLQGPCTMSPHWGCSSPPATDGCPETAPATGTACSTSGLDCVYGVRCVKSIAAERKCEDGVWVDVPVKCPV